MSAIPAVGTWVRLVRTPDDRPESKWHEVLGWDAQRATLLFACRQRDRTVSWALDGSDRFRVGRQTRRPDADICGWCEIRGAHPRRFEAPSPLRDARRRVTPSGLTRGGRPTSAVHR